MPAIKGKRNGRNGWIPDSVIRERIGPMEQYEKTPEPEPAIVMDTHILPTIQAGDIVEIAAHQHEAGKDRDGHQLVYDRPAGQYVVDYVFRGSGNLWAWRQRDESPHDRQHSFRVIHPRHVRRVIGKVDEQRRAA